MNTAYSAPLVSTFTVAELPLASIVQEDPSYESLEAYNAERSAEWRQLLGVEGGLAPLPSERDQNFRVSTEDGGVAVLKISHPAEDRGFLELQHLILARLAEATPRYRFPGPVVFERGDGAPILVRVLSWVPGVPLARARPHTAELRKRLGSMLATVDRTLEGLDHPAAHRSLRWDLRQANAVITANLPHLADAAQRQWVARLAHEAAAGVAARAAALRTGVIHNDGNDHNVLVTAVHGSPAAAETRAVEGLIDFGDVIHTWLVAEPAIAAAYAMMGQPDPLASAGDLVAGYHRVHPLTEDELAALPHLIVQRLLTSVALSRRPRCGVSGDGCSPAWRCQRPRPRRIRTTTTCP